MLVVFADAPFPIAGVTFAVAFVQIAGTGSSHFNTVIPVCIAAGVRAISAFQFVIGAASFAMAALVLVIAIVPVDIAVSAYMIIISKLCLPFLLMLL